MPKKLLPYLMLVSGIFALSLSSFFVRWAESPGIVTSFYRIGIACAIMLPFFHQRARVNGLPKWRYFLFPLFGGLFTGLDHAVWSTAIGYTKVANATLLNNIAPLWVALIALVFWKERLSVRFWIGLALAIIGAAIVISMDLLLHPHLSGGDFLALASSFFYAGFFLITQRGRSHFETITYTWLAALVSALVLLLMAWLFGFPILGYSSTNYLIFLGAALISHVGGYFSLTYALGHLPASIVSPTMIVQPILTALLAIPILGEMLTPSQWLGGLMVLCGIYLVNSARSGSELTPGENH